MSIPFITQVSGTAVHVPGADIDTDRIIPARFLKCVTFDDLAEGMFYDVRFDTEGNSCNHPLDDKRFAGASIMLAGPNFGCGSSREHAPIAIKASGAGCVIARSFARIFFRNSINVGFPILECNEAVDKIDAGDKVEVDFSTGLITNLTKNETYNAVAFPEFLQKIIEADGLINYAKQESEA